MKNNILILVFFFCCSVNAQNLVPDREEFKLTLAVDNENFYSSLVKKSPYFIEEKILQIYPSEKLNVEVEIQFNKIHTMKVVRQNINPERTITIEFRQETKGNLHDGMILVVSNPFNKNLKYNAEMFLVGGEKWLPTSILSIPPGIPSYEMWRDNIVTLVLSDWRFEK